MLDFGDTYNLNETCRSQVSNKLQQKCGLQVQADRAGF
ncbi:Uncharacterised protein [Serratia quinivorans]|nr:Uncharacterised protein [Serratia quinivorans]CAI1898986.1 Uncharacterised protein [Serratia quinivorans]